MEKFIIQLPFFCGFYESSLFNSDTLYWEFEGDNLEYYRESFGDDTLEPDDLDIDFDRYTKECCETFVEAFFNQQERPDFIKSMTFSKMTSPRYYNFETDKVFADVELEDGWRDKVLSFMDDNKEELTKRIHEEWSSRDGFISFMSNEFDEWRKHFSGEEEDDERYISTMIRYIMEKENPDVDESIIMDVLEAIYVGEYIINLKDEKSTDEETEDC